MLLICGARKTRIPLAASDLLREEHGRSHRKAADKVGQRYHDL